MRGLTHIYSGDGKGKTTASIGLATRFANYSDKVYIIQFLKDGSSGEIKFLENNTKNIKIYYSKNIHTFYPFSTDSEKVSIEDEIKNLFNIAQKLVELADFLLLDEILDAVSLGLVKEEQLLELIQNSKNKCELVLTGRDATEKIKSLCDYHSSIVPISHPFSKGILAREGVEF